MGPMANKYTLGSDAGVTLGEGAGFTKMRFWLNLAAEMGGSGTGNYVRGTDAGFHITGYWLSTRKVVGGGGLGRAAQSEGKWELGVFKVMDNLLATC